MMKYQTPSVDVPNPVFPSSLARPGSSSGWAGGPNDGDTASSARSAPLRNASAPLLQSQNVAGPLADYLPIPIGKGLFRFGQEPFDLPF